MTWKVICDHCGIGSIGMKPNLPENWLQLWNWKTFCEATDCQEAGKAEWRAEHSAPHPSKLEPT